MIAGSKLNLISVRQGKGAKGNRPLLASIQGVLSEYEDVLTDELPLELPPSRQVHHRIDLIPRAKPPSNAPYRLNQKELVELKTLLNHLFVR